MCSMTLNGTTYTGTKQGLLELCRYYWNEAKHEEYIRTNVNTIRYEMSCKKESLLKRAWKKLTSLF